MSDENAVKTWWNQASVATASNQNSTTTSNQRDDDFVLDFWEDNNPDIEESKTGVLDKNEDPVPESGWDDGKENNEWGEFNVDLDEDFNDENWDDKDSKKNESSENTESNDWDKSLSWLDDNEDSLNGGDLFDNEAGSIEDSDNNEENENIKNNESNKDNVSNDDNEDVESLEATGEDDLDDSLSWLDDNDKNSFDGDDLFDNETGSIEDNESIESSETIEDNDIVSELDSDDNFDIDLDSPSNDDSMDSNQFDLNDDNVDSNWDNEKEVADSEDNTENEELLATDTESDSNFQIDLDSNQEYWEEPTQPSNLDLIEEESNSEEIYGDESNNEQFEDDDEMNDINFNDDESNNEDIDNNETIDEIHDSSLENEWNDENLEFTDNTNNESIDNDNTSIDIDFSGNVSDEENSDEINNSDTLWNVDFSDDSNDLNGSSENIENNTNENSGQNHEDFIDVEFNLTDSSNSESDVSQNNSAVEWIDNNDINQSDETQLNDTFDSNKSNDPQTLSFDLSNSSEIEENSEQQPNLQDYLSNQTSDEDTQPSWGEMQESNEVTKSFEEETQESNQPVVDIMNFDNESSNESNNSDSGLDNPQLESMNFNLDESQLVSQPTEQIVSETLEQDISANQENIETSNWFSLDFTESNTNSDSNIQEPINQDIPQEDQITTLPTESGDLSTEINNEPTTSNTTDNEINFTLWWEEPNNHPEVVQVQSTLSLDQILDSELSSNPQYSNNSVAIPENTVGKKSKSNKLGLIFAWGLFVTAGIVAVLAFPSLLSTSNPWEINSSWDVVAIEDHWIATDTEVEILESESNNPDFVELEFPEADSHDNSTILDNSGVTSPGWTTTISTVEFPDPYGWMDDNEWISGLNNDPEPTPYIWSSDDIVYDEDPEEYEQILINDIKASISSFKSSAEWYYSYGQEHSDRKIIKYASQIIHACDTYESQISAWEWINQEALSEFESRMLDIFNKIDNYNNWWEESTQVIQNNTTQNKDDNNSTEKDELREYIYSRQ